MMVFVRTATVADLPAVEKLLRAAFHAAYDAIHGADKIETTSRSWHSQAALKANLARPWSEFLLADTGEAIAGIAYASQSSEDFVMLHQLYVDPTMTGQGIGTQLLGECFESFPEAKAFRLEVDEQNPRAAAFYERFGFRETGRIANCGHEGSGMPAIIMEKRV
jgi:ribosomal protein S18 acetylase RimI-like enzyme